MIVVETCPVCGGDLDSIEICTYPPIPKKMCRKCGWSWEGKQEEVVRVPFRPPVEYMYDTTPECCRNCSNHPRNGGSGICCCALPYMTGTGTGRKGSYTITTNATEILNADPVSYSGTSVYMTTKGE